jgi:hypothetical protein
VDERRRYLPRHQSSVYAELAALVRPCGRKLTGEHQLAGGQLRRLATLKAVLFSLYDFASGRIYGIYAYPAVGSQHSELIKVCSVVSH